jgi:DNA-binding NarL/FixJ family response regulator
MSSSPVDLVLADHHTMFRIPLRHFLHQQDDLRIGGDTGSASEVLALVRELHPDVLVLEPALPGVDGVPLTRTLMDGPVPTAVLALSAYDHPRYVRPLLDGAYVGFVHKADTTQHLLNAIRSVAHGEDEWVSPTIRSRVVELQSQNDPAALLGDRGVTPREREVLALLARGLSNEDIAARLHVAENTVRTHVSRLYRKLDISARPALIAWAWENDLVDA